MQFDDNNIDTSQLDDRRGMSGGAIGAGAGGLGIIGMLLFLLVGGMGGGGSSSGGINDILNQMQSQQGSGSGSQTGTVSTADLKARCSQPNGITEYDDCYVLKVMNETNEVWSSVLGSNYTPPKLVFFNGSTNTACGAASANMGPFYCPGDSRVYFDLNFLNQLQNQLGAQGRYAQAYIAAHEVGHHLQNQLGIEKKVRAAQQRNPKMANQYSVAMELQADCFAGVFGRLASDRGNIQITQQEFQEAMRAAAAVGDDAIQRGAGQRVNPDAFTHGTSQQRQQWFQQGYNTGDYRQCDTFSGLK